jgi:hypothetical protein
VATGLETECNGIDDDGNGIVDDVDIGKDGVCDCLKISTIGGTGGWGGGTVFDAWLEARSETPSTALGHVILTEEMLAETQILVILDVSNDRSYEPGVPEAEAQLLYDWVVGGGSVMALIGFHGGDFERERVNEMLSLFGMSYDGDDILHSGVDGTMAVDEFYDHPTTREVDAVGAQVGKAILGEEGDTMAVDELYDHPTTREVDAVGAQVGKAILGEEGDTVAEGEGAVVGQAIRVGEGKLFMWGDEWITYDSEWSEDQHPEYQVERFWLNIFKWLSPPDECQVPVIVV